MAAVLLASALTGSGCYRWSDRPLAELRAASPNVQATDGVRATGKKEASEPADLARVVLRSGEVIELKRPYAIVEVEPGVLRVTDASTPVRSVPMADVARVAEGRVSTTPLVATLVTIPAVVAVGFVAFMVVIFPRATRTTDDVGGSQERGSGLVRAR